MIDYLPIFIQNYEEIAAIVEAEQVSVEKAWTDAENVMRDQFVVDATENGVKRWESILSITPKATHTLGERKFYILARLNEQLPYTMQSLQTALESLCGKNGYTLKMDTDRYELTVKLALSNENNLEAVANLLNKMIPANLVKNVRMFNTHGILSGFTHAQLAEHTHQGVREDIL